ncbi:MAG TPA: HDOD domain-containing protein [Rhodocyclaceae bacterium]|nr:HDOD domain-containing protein [Rhodocyclaceae bacterium]
MNDNVGEMVRDHSAGTLTETVLEDSLRDIGIPPRPVILDRIGAEMRKPEPDFRHLADLISADVSLAAGLLKTANSPYFGFQTRARTVAQALIMLGLDITANAVAGLILRQIFVALPAMERFWDASARVARTSGWLVKQLGIQDNVRSDDAYTFGLFRDCGIPILLKKFPDYVVILREANGDAERPFTAVEEARCPTSHALVGSVMARSWWLPEEISTAIRHHHDVITLGAGEGLPAASTRMVALSQLAEYLVQRISGLSMTHEWEKLGAVCQSLLGLDGRGVESLVSEARDVVTDQIH